ncbi:MAG: hypothetical protein OEZ02_07240 [Anaerolineae bacterium]|nr:hypothetical protein [Anaerolineae bacterium]
MHAIISINVSKPIYEHEDIFSYILRGIYSTQKSDALLDPDNRRFIGISKIISKRNLVSVRRYFCTIDTFAVAAFLFINHNEILVLVETSQQGNLTQSVEKIIKDFEIRSKQLNIPISANVGIYPNHYTKAIISGKPSKIKTNLRYGLRKNTMYLIIAILLVIISTKWLDQYYQESIASVITLVFMEIIEAIFILQASKNNYISWKINFT